VLKCGPSAHQGVYFSLKEKLENLVRPAGRLASLAQEAAQYGIEARVDAQAAMRVCDSLPSDIPTSEMVGRVSALAIDQFHRVSDNVTNLQKMQRSAEIALSLKGVSKEDLQAIFTLNGGVSGTRLWQLPVRDLHDESKRIVDWVERDAYLMDVVRPIMRVIDYDDVSWDELLAIDCTVRHLNEMSSEEIAWFAWTNKENETTISAACNEWGQLESERRSWARRFARCRRFPRAQELSEVASLLRKGGIARAIGALAGHKKRVNALMSDLGIPDGSTVEADELDKLSSFLSKLEVFENNREYAELFGDLWQGLGSPLDLIRSAVGARLTLRNKLAEMDAGLSLFEKIDLFSEQKLLHVGKLSVGAFEASQRDRNRFGNEKILAAVNNAKKEIEAARAILRVNLPNIEGESLTLKQLVEHAKREIAQRGAVGTLEALLSLGEQSYMLDDNEWVSSLKLAADWLIASNEHLRNPKLQKAFLSIRSEADLQKIFDLAANYVQGCEQIDACILEIANDCDIRGLDHYDPKTLCGVIADVLTRPDELRRHLSLKSQRHEVSKFDLDGLLDSLEELKVDPENYPAMLDAVAAWRRADRDRRVHGVLGRASGAGLEARRSEFITQDRKKISLDRKSVANLLIVRRPPNGSSVGPKKQWTEMALLQNEFGKEKRFVPVRDLVIRAGRAIQALKPCFLMSPLSLAKYVPAKTIEFDLLIVDEASQMRPEDVLGALLRTKQLVVVGDVKQLPPTDFFQRSDQSVIEDEEHEDVDDESVLEACQKTFKQVRMLRWHYRSRCESLIAFSNREFYKNGLITFPSATPNSFSIDLVRVNGDYKAGCNLQEAQRLAEEAIALMRHYADFEREVIPTLGLVAVNSKQRDVIFEELRQLEAGDERVERYREKVASKGEPVVIKNLENVQGDERDYILISLTYGPEAGQTVVAQRFGPISSKQGHRRLNVLFSRARLRIGLFTSFGSEDVHPSDTSSEGVKVLKRYLEYAEHRGRAEHESIGKDVESDFEQEVAARLRGRGYRVESQIGVSGYRIDLGVRDPDNPTLFLTGIECDGARYHSSKSARERDRLREEILKGLGWRILRVWSTDWFDNPNSETDKLCKKIESLKRDKPERESGRYRFLSAEFSPPSSGSNGQSVKTSSDVGSVDDAIDASSDMPAETDAKSSMTEGAKRPRDVADLLRQFRDQVISREIKEWEPQRSILRDGMIETLIAQRMIDPADWFSKIPTFQRMGTSPIEKDRYLGRICEMLDEYIPS